MFCSPSLACAACLTVHSVHAAASLRVRSVQATTAPYVPAALSLQRHVVCIPLHILLRHGIWGLTNPPHPRPSPFFFLGVQRTAELTTQQLCDHDTGSFIKVVLKARAIPPSMPTRQLLLPACRYRESNPSAFLPRVFLLVCPYSCLVYSCLCSRRTPAHIPQGP